MIKLLKNISLLAFIFLIAQACELKEITEQTEKDSVACEIDSIPANEGEDMITEAQSYIDSVNTSFATGAVQIPYGAKIPLCELQEIIDDLGETPEVWAMMGMKDGKLEIVFQGLDDATSTYKYYDFTAPCPVTCPE